MNWKLPEGDGLRNLLLAALSVIVLGGAITLGVTLSDSDDDGSPDTIEIRVNTAANDAQPTKTLEVPEPAVEKARDGFTHDDLEAAPTDAAPPSDADLDRSAEVQGDVRALPEAGAIQGFSGCVTRILPTNYSSRNGARATWQVLHYTVSGNRAGWSDVNAIIALFSNPGRQASSNFVIDTEGNCAYIVPIEAKAWTQAGGNPWSISYEIIATGGESRYLEPAGMAKLKSVMEQVARRTGIPTGRGAVSGSCTPVRAGVVQHKDFGLCGGGHVDITPFDVDGVLAALQLGGPSPVLSAKERKIVKAARRPSGSGHSRRYWCRRIGAQISWLSKSPKVERRGARLKILKRVWRGRCA